MRAYWQRASRRVAASLALALLASAHVSIAGPEVSPQTKAVAQKVYEKGAADYKAGRLLEALAAFRASYEMVPSPNSHLMLARTLRDRADLPAAYREYDKLVPEAEAAGAHEAKYAKTAEIARAERAKVRAQIALVRVHVKSPPDDLHVVLGSVSVERAEWETPVPVLPGALVARATSPGGAEKSEDLVAAGGGEVDVTFDFTIVLAPPGPIAGAADQPAPPDSTDIPRQPAPGRTVAYVALGVGTAGLLTFVIAGAMNQKTFDDLETTCPAHHCPPDAADRVSKGRTEQAIANIGAGVAIAGGAVAAILFASGTESGHRNAAAATGPAPRLKVTDVLIGPGGVGLRGAF